MASSNSNAITNTISPLPPGKTAIDVFADFLKYLFRCARTFIQQSQPNGLQFWTSIEHHIQFVLTHPNGWEGAQQSQMRRAAVRAGLIEDTATGQKRVQFVTEGEASLHFCIHNGFESQVIDVRQALLQGYGHRLVTLVHCQI